MRAVAWVSAAMTQREAELAVGRCVEAHGVRRRLTARLGSARSRSQAERGEIRALRQLAHAGPSHRSGVGVVAGRPRREQIRDPLRVVGGARLDAAHRAEGAVRHRGLELPGVVFPAVAKGATFDRSGGDIVPGRRHAEWLEEHALDEVLVGLRGHVADDAAEQCVAQVRVLHRHRGRPREWHAVAQETREVVLGHRRLPITPWIVGNEPRGVRQQLAHTNFRRVGRRVLPSPQLRHVRFDGRVELRACLRP